MSNIDNNKIFDITTPGGTAIVPAIELPLLVDPGEVLLAANENIVEGEIFRFDRIKMPGGGGITFELQDENGVATAHPSLKMIIIGFKPFKSWYEKTFDERDPDKETPLPDCFSADTVTGSGCNCESYKIPAGQLCAQCPLNEWGSSRKGGRGKECHDRMRVWFLLEGYAVPMYIDLPKTSLGNFRDYRKRLTNKAKTFYGVITTVKLEKATSTDGKKITFSKAVFNASGELDRTERTTVKQYMKAIEGSLKITRDTIADAPADHELDAEPDRVTDSINNDQAY